VTNANIPCCVLAAVLCYRLNLRENELETEGAVTLACGLAALPALQVGGAVLQGKPCFMGCLIVTRCTAADVCAWQNRPQLVADTRNRNGLAAYGKA
jgi:hypothetical protein